MSPRKWTTYLLLTCTASVSFELASCRGVGAQWQPLVDEPSRAELFRDFARAERIKHPEASFSFALPYTFEFPHDAIFDTNGAPRDNELFGLDISHHQGQGFPFQLLKDQGVSFVYVKATQGTTFMDNAFADNWRALGALGNGKRIPRGAYHFLSSDPKESGEDQADRFLEFVTLAGGFRRGDLPPALDLEWDKACSSCNDRWAVNQRTADDIIGVVRAFSNTDQERYGTNSGLVHQQVLSLGPPNSIE